MSDETCAHGYRIDIGTYCDACEMESQRDDARERVATLERELAEAVEVQEDLAGRLFDAVRERDFARQYRCPDCHWHDGGSMSPCVRHNGCEHGMPGEYDDTWEHWRKRALAAENGRDALAAERAMFCALVESLTSERDEARQMLKEQAAHTPMLDAMEKVAGDIAKLGGELLMAERDQAKAELAEARRQLGEADDKLLAIAGIVNGYHNDTAEAASWDCMSAIAAVLGPPWADAPAPQHPAPGGEDPGKMETP